MRRPMIVPAVFATLTTLAATACSSSAPSALPQTPSPIPQTTPLPAASPASAPPTQISVWQNVEGRLTTAHPADVYELTSSEDGTLMVRLDWDVWTNGTLLSVRIDGTEFRPRPPDWAPLIVTSRIAANQRCQLRVEISGSDWIPDDHYRLVTSLQ
jgi:hypothetical protein